MAIEAFVSSLKVMNQGFIKLDHFDGIDFTRWQEKMRLFLTAMKIFYVSDLALEPISEPTEKDYEKIKAGRKEADDFLCRDHILNTLSDCLYDLYTDNPLTAEIWKALEYGFKAEEECTKVFFVSSNFDFKMFDDKPILVQVHDLEVLVKKMKGVKINILETFKVVAIFAKLPNSWNCYRKKLPHGTKDFSLEQIQKHFRIAQESRMRDKTTYSETSKADR